MFSSFFLWWYGAGWALQKQKVVLILKSTLDTFSFELLIETLFSPFRQLSVGEVRGPLGVQLRAIFDRFLSRCIGAMIRLAMIFVGVLAVIFLSVIGLLRLIVWPVLPAMPVFGLVVSLIFGVGA